jgi:hypothetical protein
MRALEFRLARRVIARQGPDRMSTLWVLWACKRWADCRLSCVESPWVELTLKDVNVEKFYDDFGLPSRNSQR